MPTLLFLGGIGFAAWWFLRKKEPGQTAFGFDVGLQGPASLPNSAAVIGEALQKLGVDPATIADASIAQVSGVNVLSFVTRTGAPVPHLPPVGTTISVAGVPLVIASIQPITSPH
jgi:hypothetical protein